MPAPCNYILNIIRCSLTDATHHLFSLIQWASDCCLTPNEQFFSNIMTRTSYSKYQIYSIWPLTQSLLDSPTYHSQGKYIKQVHFLNRQMFSLDSLNWPDKENFQWIEYLVYMGSFVHFFNKLFLLIYCTLLLKSNCFRNLSLIFIKW